MQLVREVARSRPRCQRLGFDEDTTQLPLREAALELDGAEQRRSVQVAVPEVPTEHQPRDDLAVHPLVFVEPGIAQELRHERGEGASVEMHHPKAHHLADDAHGRLAVVEARQLVVDPARAGRQSPELLVALPSKEPHAVRPVSSVITHTWKKRKRPRRQVAAQRHADQDHRQKPPQPERSRGAVEDGGRQDHLRMRPEQGERSVDDHHVPLEGDPHRDVARDEPVEREDERERDPHRPARAGQHEREGDRHLERRPRMTEPRRDPRRPEIVGEAPVHQPTDPAETDQRAVARHDADDRREVVIQLREARKKPQRELHGLRPPEPIRRDHHHDQRRPVVLRTHGEKQGPIRQPHERDERHDRPEPRHRRRERGSREGPHRRADPRRVERHVEHRPATTEEPARGGLLGREIRQLRGAGPQEIERAAHRRKIPPRQRSAATAEAEPLEEHAPEDRFLERERREPIPRDLGWRAQLRR
jgi:hypothetical protein